MKTQNITLAQGEISYLQKNPEGPPVLFIHGNNNSKESFEKQFQDDLFSSYHLIALDLPGHGESSPMENFYSIHGLAESVVQFCRQLELAKPILVGHSLGGHIAIRTSTLMDIGGLVISQTPPLESLDDLSKGFAPSDVLGLLFTKDLTEEQKTSIAQAFTTDGGLQEKIKTWTGRTDPRFRELLGASLATDSFKEVHTLRHLQAPYISLGTSADPLINRDYVKEILGENLFEIEGTTHFPHIEWWHLYNHYLAIFLGEATRGEKKETHHFNLQNSPVTM